MTRVKICGIQKLNDALVAAEAGGDFIGLVFVPNRRRRLSIEAARSIVDGLKATSSSPPQIAGLFADQPLEEVNHTIKACGLDLAQLCGQESLDYCRRVPAQVIKVLHIPSTGPTSSRLSTYGRSSGHCSGADSGGGDIDGLAETIEMYHNSGHLVNLDRLVAGLQGGTGQSFDWSIAARLSQRGHSFLLAGGLTPENVAQAIATAQPWGVDVSTGVETDGVKDPQKIRAFIRQVRRSGI
jgi:phosphoribosylanthranilate isomerase